MEPVVTLVVVSHNCKPWFARFFKSIQEQSIFERIEILMVDNSSQDGSAELCEQEMKLWRNGCFVPTRGNFGYGGGCNLGANQARGKYLFFINPDVWLEPDCLEVLVRQAEASSAKVLSALMLRYESERPTPDDHGEGICGFDMFGCRTGHPLGKPVEPVFTVANFFFIERELFHRLGGFDGEFFVYGEEMDLSWRVWLAGERIELVRAARVHHASATSTDEGSRTSEFRRFYANRNQLLIVAKNSEGPLLLLAFTNLALIALEAVAGALLSRNVSFIHASFFQPLADGWRLRHHVMEQRRLIRRLRRRGDGWIGRRFFRFGLGHWADIKRFLKWKIVIDKFKSPAKTASLLPPGTLPKKQP